MKIALRVLDQPTPERRSPKPVLNLLLASRFLLCPRYFLTFRFLLSRCGDLPFLLLCSGGLRSRKTRRGTGFFAGGPARIRLRFRSRRRGAGAGRAGFPGHGYLLLLPARG